MKKFSALTRDFKRWAAQTFGLTLSLKGKVDEYRFTFGGAGNQWTTIDGKEYATYWNIYTKDWEKGDRVMFDVFYEPLMGRYDPVFQAKNIRRINDENGSTPIACPEPMFV